MRQEQDWNVGGYFLETAALEPGDVLIRHEDSGQGPGWLRFRQPAEILIAGRAEEVERVLDKACLHGEHAWSAGFLSYEAATALHPEIPTHAPRWPVLAWFGLYEAPPLFYRELAPVYEPLRLDDLRREWSFAEYEQAFHAVKSALANGVAYQVNLTFRQSFSLAEPAWRLFASRCGVRPPPYAAYVHGGDWQVASFSPELLFERTGNQVVTEPMKGTAPAPPARSAGEAAARALRQDPKSIAENIMIVDMARNDLGSICERGSVATPALLEVSRHRGLLQMTSRVTGRYSGPTFDLIRALFPAASVTGAPKVSTTRLIRDLETSPRHVYCGAIGVIGPEWQRFGVGIRTALCKRHLGQYGAGQGDAVGEFGIGSGVVWDSVAASEYAECLAKNDVLGTAAPQWELVEALGANDLDSAETVERHLGRLARQAERFAIPIDLDAVRNALAAIPRPRGDARVKVRIALRRNGDFAVSFGPSVIQGHEISAILAKEPIRSKDPNLRLKTSSRGVYDAQLDRHANVEEVLLYNEAGLLTEFCNGNVLLRIAGRLKTPSPESGCLPGLAVAALVQAGDADYAGLTVSDLEHAEEIFFANSVVGLISVRLAR